MQSYSEEYRDQQYRLPGGRQTLHAHDVRYLTVCCECNGLADERMALPPSKTRGWMHPRCYYGRYGLDGVLKLPKLHKDRFCLSDMPAADMKKFLSLRT